MSRLGSFIEDNFPAALRLWKRRNAGRLRGLPMAEAFTAIYRDNYWGDAESRSGTASSLDNTRAIRAALPALVTSLGVRSLLDIPCGDFHWMRHVDLDLDRYIGADIVEELVTANMRFENATRTFLRLDITSDSLPDVDLVLCRDCLIHFSFADITRAIANLKASRSRYLLTTTFTRMSRRNVDIVTGQWRALNLQRPPFSFPAPLEVIGEGIGEDKGAGRFGDRSLALWRLADL